MFEEWPWLQILNKADRSANQVKLVSTQLNMIHAKKKLKCSSEYYIWGRALQVHWTIFLTFEQTNANLFSSSSAG